MRMIKVVFISGVDEKYIPWLINIQPKRIFTGKCCSSVSYFSSSCQQKPSMSRSVVQCLHLCKGGCESWESLTIKKRMGRREKCGHKTTMGLQQHFLNMLGIGQFGLSHKPKIFHRKRAKLSTVNISIFFRNITSAEKWEVPINQMPKNHVQPKSTQRRVIFLGSLCRSQWNLMSRD